MFKENDPNNVREIDRKGVRFKVLRSMCGCDYEKFWNEFESGVWEPATLAMIEHFSDHKTKFYDVGGWIGPTSIWAAHFGCDVFCFEPDPIALRALRANIALNPHIRENIRVIPAAAGEMDGDMEIYAVQFGTSETSTFSRVQRSSGIRLSSASISVPMVSLPSLIRSQEPHTSKQFIKIDIEGGEFSLLPALRDVLCKYDIPMSVEFHPMNIVSENPDHTPLERVNAYAKVLDLFKDFHWYDLDVPIRSELTKTQTLSYVLKNINKPFQMVISRKPVSSNNEAARTNC